MEGGLVGLECWLGKSLVKEGLLLDGGEVGDLLRVGLLAAGLLRRRGLFFATTALGFVVLLLTTSLLVSHYK